MDKGIEGLANFRLANGKFNGDLSVALDESLEIIPGVLTLNGGKFTGKVNDKKQIQARLETSFSTPDNKYLTINASSAYVEYDSARGETSNAWEIGIKSLQAGLFNNKVSMSFQDAKLNLADKALMISKVTLAYAKGNSDEERPQASGGFDWGNIEDILKIMKNFHVEATLNNVTIDSKGVHFDGKKPDWSLKNLEMEYMGFTLGLTINDTEVTGKLKGAFSKEFNIFSLELEVPVPAAPGINLVGGINVVAQTSASADIDVTYDKEKSTAEDMLLRLHGGASLDGGLHLEAVLGASVGVPEIASLGGQLFGRFGTEISSKVDAGATLRYNRRTRKLSQGPDPQDKFRMHADSTFSPVLTLGGRLVFKLLGKKFNLFEYRFGEWRFGEGRLVFDVEPDKEGRYSIQVDKKATHFNNKRFLNTGTLKDAINDIPEESAIKEKYGEFRDLLDEAEKVDGSNREEKIKELSEQGPKVEKNMCELMEMLVTRKEKVSKELELLDDDDSDLGFFSEMREHLREFKQGIEMKNEIKTIYKEIEDLRHEIKKVMLVNLDPRAAVDLLVKRRNSFKGKFDYKKFGIWDALPRFMAKRTIGYYDLSSWEKKRDDVQQRLVQEAKTIEDKIDFKVKGYYNEIIEKVKRKKDTPDSEVD